MHSNEKNNIKKWIKYLFWVCTWFKSKKIWSLITEISRISSRGKGTVFNTGDGGGYKTSLFQRTKAILDRSSSLSRIIIKNYNDNTNVTSFNFTSNLNSNNTNVISKSVDAYSLINLLSSKENNQQQHLCRCRKFKLTNRKSTAACMIIEAQGRLSSRSSSACARYQQQDVDVTYCQDAALRCHLSRLFLLRHRTAKFSRFRQHFFFFIYLSSFIIIIITFVFLVTGIGSSSRLEKRDWYPWSRLKITHTNINQKRKHTLVTSNCTLEKIVVVVIVKAAVIPGDLGKALCVTSKLLSVGENQRSNGKAFI